MKQLDIKQEVANANALVDLVLDDEEMVLRLFDREIEETKRRSPLLDDQSIEAIFQPFRRLMLRTIMAGIEAYCFKTKNLFLLLCDCRGVPVSKAERADILEKTTNKDGKVINHFPETKYNIKLTFKILHRAFDQEFKVTDLKNWGKLCQAVDIRNRITHPKNLDDMSISKEEYEDIVEGLGWFSQKIRTVVTRLQETGIPPKRVS